MQIVKFEKKDFKMLFFVVLSAFIYACGFNIFVKSGNLFPGGFAGISRLLLAILSDFCHINISFSVIYMTLNVITSIVVFKKIGKKFMIFSIMHYFLVSLFTTILPSVMITEDILLISVFGGLINGFAISIALRNNASSGGSDFIAIYFSIRFNVSTWNYVLCMNAVVLVLAGLLFGWEKALYSIIFQFVSTQVVNTMHNRYKSSQLDIITNMPDEICNAVFHTCRHGITKIRCTGGFTNKEHWLLIMAVNQYQLKNVVDSIKRVDPHAFITLHNVDRVIGNYYQKPLE